MERKEAGPTAADMAIARDIEAFEAELGRRGNISPATALVEVGSDPSTHPLVRDHHEGQATEQLPTVALAANLAASDMSVADEPFDEKLYLQIIRMDDEAVAIGKQAPYPSADEIARRPKNS